VFALHVNDDEEYEIVNCEPPIDAKTLIDVGQTVNENGDISAMVRRMRKLDCVRSGVLQYSHVVHTT
jgi:hypothetical protein